MTPNDGAQVWQQTITDWQATGVAPWVIRLNGVLKPLQNFKASLVGAFFCLCSVSLGE
jgi:hypothetical protein